jgi:hypothetical protein
MIKSGFLTKKAGERPKSCLSDCGSLKSRLSLKKYRLFGGPQSVIKLRPNKNQQISLTPSPILPIRAPKLNLSKLGIPKTSNWLKNLSKQLSVSLPRSKQLAQNSFARCADFTKSNLRLWKKSLRQCRNRSLRSKPPSTKKPKMISFNTTNLRTLRWRTIFGKSSYFRFNRKISYKSSKTSLTK